jgi:hypothetical protein
MIPPRYRTLDGDELELPLAMDCWVIVPRALARFDPELAWTLDYEDAPAPEDADPRLDFSTGALLVPVERWNEHAVLEPNLAPCSCGTGAASVYRRPAPSPPAVAPADRGDPKPSSGQTTADVARRAIVAAIAALALSYAVGVGAWLWSLRHGVSGPGVSTGLMLVGIAVLVAWLAGVAGAAWRPPRARPRRRSWPQLGVAIVGLSDDPLAILRLGIIVQLTGFAALVILR